MASPLETAIYNDKFATYKNSGLFVKRTVANPGTINASFVTDPNDIPDALKNVLHQDATALALTWLNWQSAQGVAVINHIDSVPDYGVPPVTGLVP